MLGGEAEKHRQFSPVVSDPLDDLGVFRRALPGERGNCLGRTLLVLAVAGLPDRALDRGRGRLRQRVENVRRLVHPAPLVAGLGDISFDAFQKRRGRGTVPAPAGRLQTTGRASRAVATPRWSSRAYGPRAAGPPRRTACARRWPRRNGPSPGSAGSNACGSATRNAPASASARPDPPATSSARASPALHFDTISQPPLPLPLPLPLPEARRPSRGRPGGRLRASVRRGSRRRRWRSSWRSS